MTTKDHRFFFIAVFVAVYSIGSLLSTLLYGGYSDQYGRRKVLLLSLLILAIGYVISGTAIGIYWIPILFLGQFISGVGDSFRPFAFTILADTYKRPYQRMTAFGIFAASDGVLAGTYFITNYWQHFPALELAKYPAIPYFSVAAIGVLIWLIFFLNFSGKKRVEHPSKNPFKGYSELFHSKGIARLLILFFLATMPFLTLQATHPLYLHMYRSLSQLQVLILYLTMSLSWMVASCLFFPYLAHRHPIGKILFYTFSGYFIFWIFSGWTWETFFYYLIPLFSGLALGIIWPSIQGLISLITSSKHQGKAMTHCYFILISSSVIGPLLLEDYVLQHWTIFYCFFAITNLTGALISYSLKKFDQNLKDEGEIPQKPFSPETN